MDSYEYLGGMVDFLILELFIVKSSEYCVSCEDFRTAEAYKKLHEFNEFIGLARGRYTFHRREFDWNGFGIERIPDKAVDKIRYGFFEECEPELIQKLEKLSYNEMNDDEVSLYKTYLDLPRKWDEEIELENYLIYYANFEYAPAIRLYFLQANDYKQIKLEGLKANGSAEEFFEYLARNIAGLLIPLSERKLFVHDNVSLKPYRLNDPTLK